MCLVVPNEDALTFSVFDTFKGELLNELVEMLFSIKVPFSGVDLTST